MNAKFSKYSMKESLWRKDLVVYFIIPYPRWIRLEYIQFSQSISLICDSVKVNQFAGRKRLVVPLWLYLLQESCLGLPSQPNRDYECRPFWMLIHNVSKWCCKHFSLFKCNSNSSESISEFRGMLSRLCRQDIKAGFHGCQVIFNFFQYH